MKNFSKLMCGGLSMAALLALNLNAAPNEEVNLDEIIISASGFEQAIKEAPATINVVTQKDLQSKPYRDIAE